MFAKIHYALYDILFEIYGLLIKRYLEKMKDDAERGSHWKRKIDKCVDKREDILEIMFALKGAL